MHKELLKEIKQRKGEAEMAQVDWLPTMQDDLEDNEAIVAVVTSADRDSIAIHLFSISFYWARKENGKFKNPLIGFPDSLVNFIKFVSVPGVSITVYIHFSCDIP
jgi:hypothetical protein